jgi:hypothetical protein
MTSWKATASLSSTTWTFDAVDQAAAETEARKRAGAAATVTVEDVTPASALRQDPMTDPDPANLWGSTVGDLADPSRQVLKSSGGPDGGPYRQLTVKDGDSMGFSGERAELGNNNRSAGLASPSNHSGTFWLGQSGKSEVIRYSLRLPSTFPSSGSAFQNVTQLKHTCPCSDASSDQPELTLQVRSNQFRLYGNLGTAQLLWSTPVIKGSWVPIEWQVTWSKSSSIGKVQLKVGSAQSPVFTRQTLAYLKSSGTPMPSHLRVGCYHDASYPGTSIDIGPVTVN